MHLIFPELMKSESYMDTSQENADVIFNFYSSYR